MSGFDKVFLNLSWYNKHTTEHSADVFLILNVICEKTDISLYLVGKNTNSISWPKIAFKNQDLQISFLNIFVNLDQKQKKLK